MRCISFLDMLVCCTTLVASLTAVSRRDTPRQAPVRAYAEIPSPSFCVHCGWLKELLSSLLHSNFEVPLQDAPQGHSLLKSF